MTDSNSEQGKPGGYQPGQLRAFLDLMRTEVDGSAELLKQSLADLNAMQRQDHRNDFEVRLEFTRQVTQLRNAALDGIVEYGSQTLKWAFLLNAGAIVAILAFAGAAGKAPSTGAAQALAPLIRALWPFAVGCIFVVASGAAAYINFCYAEGCLPTSEALANFVGKRAASWPLAKLQREKETAVDFYNRIGWYVNLWRGISIGLAATSMVMFAYGIFRVLRAVT